MTKYPLEFNLLSRLIKPLGCQQPKENTRISCIEYRAFVIEHPETVTDSYLRQTIAGEHCCASCLARMALDQIPPKSRP